MRGECAGAAEWRLILAARFDSDDLRGLTEDRVGGRGEEGDRDDQADKLGGHWRGSLEAARFDEERVADGYRGDVTGVTIKAMMVFVIPGRPEAEPGT